MLNITLHQYDKIYWEILRIVWTLHYQGRGQESGGERAPPPP